jgi:hypothetical protein
MSILTTLPDQLYDAGAFKGFRAGSSFTIENASHLERKFVTLVDSSNLYRGERLWRMELCEAGRSRR